MISNEREQLFNERERLIANIANLKKSIAHGKDNLFCCESFMQWNALKEYKLEKNDCSRVHKIIDAFKSDAVQTVSEFGDDIKKDSHLLFKNTHPFVVAHDWLGALGDAVQNFDDEIILPYPSTTFEFRINGKNVIALGLQPDSEKLGFVTFVDGGNGHWLCIGDENNLDSPVLDFVWKQIKAICVALDAEVAVREVIRAPTALNKKIAKTNRCQLFDFHIVNLAKRYKSAPVTIKSETGNHKRLHFRRGHWRHYDNFKTWVKWALVGDPSLGFVDKQYRL